MSTTADSKPTPERSLPIDQPTTNAHPPASRPPLKLLWPTLVLAAYWIVVQGGYLIPMAMFPRFISRVIALLVLAVFFLVWGMTRRHFTWKQRFAGLAIVVATMIAAGLVSDSTVRIPGVAMTGLPIVLTASTAWLLLTRSGTARRELAGVAVVSLVVFGAMSLLRWEGLDGRQRSQLAWRWTPTAEELFLDDLRSESADDAAAIDAAVEPIHVSEGDWASFRGGERENVVTGVTLGDWNADQPRELWRKRVGPGWSSLIALGEALVTQEQRGDREAVVCYRTADGEELWAYSWESRFEEALSGTGPRATPSAVDDRIVAYGSRGTLVCLDASTGSVHWKRDILTESEGAVPMWGLSVSPLIVDGLAVVFAGGTNDRGLLACDLDSGETRWNTAAGTMTYSSPQLMTIDGVRQIVMQDEQSLFAVDVADGRRLWSHPSPNAGSFQPMIQPHLVGDDRLIVGWGNGILSLEVRRNGDAWQVSEQWTSTRLKPGFNDFVVQDDFIYGLDDGILCCVAVKDGKRMWKGGRYGFGQVLLLPAMEELLILTEKGDVVRVAATPDDHRETGSFKAIGGKTWNHPIVARGRLVVRNGEEMACFDLSNGIEAVSTEE